VLLFPASHWSQEDAPALLACPGKQAAQVEAAPALDVPAEQVSHDERSSEEN